MRPGKAAGSPESLFQERMDPWSVRLKGRPPSEGVLSAACLSGHLSCGGWAAVGRDGGELLDIAVLAVGARWDPFPRG